MFGCGNSPSKGHRKLKEYCKEAPLPASSLLLWGHRLWAAGRGVTAERGLWSHLTARAYTSCYSPGDLIILTTGINLTGMTTAYTPWA